MLQVSTMSFSDARSAALAPKVRHLTRRQLQVAELIAQGMRHKEIGARLGIKESASKVFTFQIYRRTGLSNAVEVANWVHGRSAYDVVALLKAMGVAA